MSEQMNQKQSSMKIVDARGLACPSPVVLTMKALKEVDELTVIVDNETARENVSRLAKSHGFSVSIEESTEAIYLHLTKVSASVEKYPKTATSQVILIASDALGQGDRELGTILMSGFIYALGESDPKPSKVIFMNSGVKLVTKGSKAISDLRRLESLGIEIIACGTCLGYYGLNDFVEIGQVSNMYAITEELLQADKTITL